MDEPTDPPVRRQLLPVRADRVAAGVPAGRVQLPAAGPDLDAARVLAAGALVAVGLAGLGFGYQVRRFRREAAMVPELYQGPSPRLPGWNRPGGPDGG